MPAHSLASAGKDAFQQPVRPSSWSRARKHDLSEKVMPIMPAISAVMMSSNEMSSGSKALSSRLTDIHTHITASSSMKKRPTDSARSRWSGSPPRIRSAQLDEVAAKTRSMMSRYGGIPRFSLSAELTADLPSAPSSHTWRGTGRWKREKVSRGSCGSKVCRSRERSSALGVCDGSTSCLRWSPSVRE